MKRVSANPFIPALIIVAIFIVSCRNPMGVQPLDEAPTRGNIRISVDESFQLLYDTQLYTFESLYSNAKIAASYKPELEVLDDFMKD